MIVAAGVVVVIVVVVIAAAVVTREASRLARNPPPALFDLGDALDWIVEHIPDEIAATLTADDVERILELQTEYFEREGVAANGAHEEMSSAVVVGGARQVAFIEAQAALTGEAYSTEQVRAVVDTQLSYLRAIGAIGPRAAGGRKGSATEPPTRGTSEPPEEGGGPHNA